MDVRSFVQRNREVWNELEDLLQLFAKQPKRAGAAEIDRLTLLYRTVSSQLSFMRTESPKEEVTGYLNHLVSRTHHMLYQEQYKSSHQLGYFFRQHLPSLLRKRWSFAAIACLLFLFGAVSGYLSVWLDASNLFAVLPDSMTKGIDPNRIGEGAKEAPHALLSTAIMTNNIRVAILAFVSGITLGIWTIYLMAYNGLIVGALAAYFAQSSKAYTFWAYILPHGVIELTAIFIAGGAGLYMGYTMLVPGPYPRKYALLRTAKESVQLLLGTVPLFVVAGLIEGYITPSGLSLETKYAFALLTLLLLAAFAVYCRFQSVPVQNASRDFISK